MTLHDVLMDELRLPLKMHHHPGQSHEWMATLHDVGVRAGEGFVVTHGCGTTPEEALQRLCAHISGQTLYLKDGTEVVCPMLDEHGLGAFPDAPAQTQTVPLGEP